MDGIKSSDLKTVLHSKRANLYYLEHCRVLVHGGRVAYVTDQGKQSLYWNIPIANTTSLLLGTGTSITQAAVRELSRAGVMMGFCGGGGTPLFAATEHSVDIEWLAPQSEYRPTEYLQHWCRFWFDNALRLQAAKSFQFKRLQTLHKPDVRAAIHAYPEADHLFVVLATAVAEVGRDHDYDWAVVEPSSMRSIIQLAGRVRRHRTGAVLGPNIALLDCNLKALESPQGAAFTRPGFETSLFTLQTHRLNDLLRHEEMEHIDATARITQTHRLHPTLHLSDLEHARMGGVMETLADDDLPEELQNDEPSVRRWWQTLSHLTAYEQRKKTFSQRPTRSRRVCAAV